MTDDRRALSEIGKNYRANLTCECLPLAVERTHCRHRESVVNATRCGNR